MVIKMNSKYFTLYNKIVEDIEKGILKHGSKLPSENDYMQKYNISRDTVRKALNMLEQSGYINKIKGKGSFVLDINRHNFSVSGLISFKEVSEKMGKSTKTYVKELELIEADDYLSSKLNIKAGDKVWKVVRVREIENKKIILDIDYFNSNYVNSLTREICEGSIYDYLENVLKLKINFAKKEITVQQCSDGDRKYLDMNGFDMIVLVDTTVYLQDGTLFQYTESRHRPDKFKFVDFARRNY